MLGSSGVESNGDSVCAAGVLAGGAPAQPRAPRAPRAIESAETMQSFGVIMVSFLLLSDDRRRRPLEPPLSPAWQTYGSHRIARTPTPSCRRSPAAPIVEGLTASGARS